MSRDFMSDCGLDEKPELNSEPLFKAEMPEALPSPGPFHPGARVRHRTTDRKGRIKFIGSADGPRTIAVEWDDGSVGMFGAEELSAEF